ncbi:MAG: UDP-2,4-diacetamido-2,4,6-trideoxy-beta-L-altropyranose hydrolase [Vulcanimicrobiaceae bacterium]
MRIAVRADAGLLVGSGHVMRTLALASALRARGAAVTFLSRRRDGDMHERIVRDGFAVRPLESETDAGDAWLGASMQSEIAACTRALQAEGGADALVVDHYRLDAAWERAMRPFARRIVVIDDLADRPHDCDLLVDANLGAGEHGRYRELAPGAHLLLGPGYALLREEFREPIRRARPRDGRIERINVFMGGFDRTDETSKVLRALGSLPGAPLRIDVVLPAWAPHGPAVRERCMGKPAIHVYDEAAEMAALFEAADLAVGAGGCAIWERCALGLPSIVLSVADNQRAGAGQCEVAGAALWLGDAAVAGEPAIAAAVEELRRNPRAVAEMSRRARSVCGARSRGFSTDLVAGAVLEAIDART